MFVVLWATLISCVNMHVMKIIVTDVVGVVLESENILPVNIYTVLIMVLVCVCLCGLHQIV